MKIKQNVQIIIFFNKEFTKLNYKFEVNAYSDIFLLNLMSILLKC